MKPWSMAIPSLRGAVLREHVVGKDALVAPASRYSQHVQGSKQHARRFLCTVAGSLFIQGRAGRKPHGTSLKSTLNKEIVIPEPVLSEPSSRAVVWFRSGDLRVRDHCGLQAAVKAPRGFLCCYVFEAQELARLSVRRMALLRAAVDDLKSQLAELGVCLHILFSEDGARSLYDFCCNMKVTDIYVHDDPLDLRVKSHENLSVLCAEHTKLRLQRWRAPLRLAVGSLGECATYDDYVSALEALKTSEISEPCELLGSLVVDPIAALESQSECDEWQSVAPTLEELQENLRVSSNEQFLFRQKQKYVRGLGADTATEKEAFRLLDLYVNEGAEAVATDLWGGPGDTLPGSKEEWAFRRIAMGPDGYKGLRPGEVFSRALSEEMLWLGCISMRTVAKELKRNASEDCRAALEALEANEWHRLLALFDLAARKTEKVSKVAYFRWRGYLCRYIGPIEDHNSLPPLVAVHGFAASCMQFTSLANALHLGRNHPMPVYALDLIGFGHAEKPPLSITQYVWEQCVKDFLLGIVGRPAVLMGNSIGGYMVQSAAAFLGPQLCLGIVLLNSAGPLFSMEEYEQLLESGGGTVLERMRRGFGEEAQLPKYAPPPQWLVDFGAWLLLSGLQPRIEGILKSLYPSNPNSVGDLAVEILRDSKDPFASNVIGCFSRLGPNRPTNELLKEYANFEDGTDGGESSGCRGRLLICQGMADLLGGGPGNQPKRLQSFVSAVPELQASGVPIEGCGHCPHDEAPAKVADAVLKWLEEVIAE